MFLLVSFRHVGAHPDELEHGVSIQSSINFGKTFPRISRMRVMPSTQNFTRVFEHLPPFISQILDFTCRMVLIFILIYFEWRDTENQQYLLAIMEFGFRIISKLWRSRRVLSAEADNTSEIFIIPQMIRKPNSRIVLLFIQNNSPPSMLSSSR